MVYFSFYMKALQNGRMRVTEGQGKSLFQSGDVINKHIYRDFDYQSTQEY